MAGTKKGVVHCWRWLGNNSQHICLFQPGFSSACMVLTKGHSSQKHNFLFFSVFFLNKPNSLAEETKQDTFGTGKAWVYTDTVFLVFFPPKGPIPEGLRPSSPVVRMSSVHLLFKDILCCNLLHQNFIHSLFSNCIFFKYFVFRLGLTDWSPHDGEEEQRVPLLALRCALHLQRRALTTSTRVKTNKITCVKLEYGH